MSQVLTDEQVERFHTDGFLAIPGFADASACRDLKGAAEAIVDAFDAEHHRSVFTTNEQERASDEEFLSSGGRVHCFFEEEAFRPDGTLGQPKHLSINKIGHAQHDLDPTFERFTYTSDLARVAADIGMADALALQSMYIFKQPLIGGEVGCHQDATFLYTDPITVTGFWFAVQDATLENGCMWAAPGGHRTSLRKTFHRAGATDSDGTRFEIHDAAPLPDPKDLVPLPVPAGTLILLHGLLPHWSDVNRSPVSRHAYTVHCISGAADYPDWNWLQRPTDMPLRRLDSGIAA